MNARDCLTTFRNKALQCRSMIARAHTQDASGQYVLTEPERSSAYAKCFLDLHIAYEEFIETITIHYLLGGLTQMGTTVVRYVSPIDEQHANNILIGSQRYFDWTNPTLINKIIKLYLKDGGPILPAYNGISSDLIDIKTIRNGCAHFSTTTQNPLDSLYAKLTGRVFSPVTISQLLSESDPNDRSRTIYQRYESILDSSAEAMTK